jgi:hypothetical protein
MDNSLLSLRTRENVTPDLGTPAGRKDLPPAFGPGLRLPAERDLMKHGALLDAWTDRETGHRVALARDPRSVRATLADHYGEFLDVVESRWGRELLDGIRSAVPDRLLMSFGNDIGPGQQMRTALTLLYLPTSLTHVLSRFPTDALSLAVLIAPRRSAHAALSEPLRATTRARQVAAAVESRMSQSASISEITARQRSTRPRRAVARFGNNLSFPEYVGRDLDNDISATLRRRARSRCSSSAWSRTRPSRAAPPG